MIRSMRIRPGCFLLTLILFALVLSCSDSSDSGEIAVDLANRLTSALTFEGGTLKDGDPPEEHDGEAYPQIIALNAPERIEAGQSFTLILEGSVPDPAEVVGAIVVVEQADGYLEVLAEYDAETDRMVLIGELSEDKELYENSFSIHVALLNTDGMVGNYITWEVEIVGEGDGNQDWESYCEDTCVFNIDCGYATDGGRDVSLEECMLNCREDADRVSVEHGEDCMEAVIEVVSCAIQLSCESYIDAFRLEPLQCLPENAAMRQACPNVNSFEELYNP